MGRLSLSASHQGGHVVIKVIDDGGGLNRKRILEKAREQGLPAHDDMPDEEVWKLIFFPRLFQPQKQLQTFPGAGRHGRG